MWRAQEDAGLDDALRFVVVSSGQAMLSLASERFQQSVEYHENVVGLLTPVQRTPSVRMDPERSLGQPAIRNVRTESIAEDFRAGTPMNELADLYDLTLSQIDEAIRFELIAAGEHAA